MTYSSWIVPFLWILEGLLREYITYLIQTVSLGPLFYSNIFMTSLFPFSYITLIFRLFFSLILFLSMGIEK